MATPREPRGRAQSPQPGVGQPRRRTPGQQTQHRPAGSRQVAGQQPRAPRLVQPQVRRPLLPPARSGQPRRRGNILVIFVTVLMLVVAGRLVQIQGFQAEALATQASASRTVTTKIPAIRGQILDANGVVLAASVKRYDVSVNQVDIAQWSQTIDGVKVGGPADAAKMTAELLEMNQGELAAAYTGTLKFKYIKKDVLPEVWDAINALKIHGIYATQTTKRVYPAGNIAGNVIGFLGAGPDGNGDVDPSGQAGVELTQNSKLAGADGSSTHEKGKRDIVIPTADQKITPAIPGSDVTLTIVRDIQYVAEQALKAQIKKYGASGGNVTVMDTRSGAVYASAEARSVDPNNPSASEPEDLGNKSVSTVFEPGSTAKVITMGAALELGIASPTTKFTVPDTYLTQNGQRFRDSHPHAKENWTLTGILSNSSNTGTVMVGEQIPAQVRYDYLRKFGFGDPTGIELAGESRGILHPADKWDGRTKYTVLFGQGVAVTALQAASVFATIGNGGKQVKPHLIKAATNEDGELVTTPPTTGERVVSEKTATQLMTMLESTVIDGTGKPAAIAGYRVAGKTGTAQAADKSGKMNNIVASFIGVVPAENPRLVISVSLDNPSERISIYGGVVAGPVFSEVGAYALQELGIEPSNKKAKLFKETWGSK